MGCSRAATLTLSPCMTTHCPVGMQLKPSNLFQFNPSKSVGTSRFHSQHQRRDCDPSRSQPFFSRAVQLITNFHAWAASECQDQLDYDVQEATYDEVQKRLTSS